MNNTEAKKLLQEIRSNLDSQQPLAIRIDEILSHKTYLDQRKEISEIVQQQKKTRLELEERKLALREQAMNLRLQAREAKSTRSRNSLWPKNQDQAQQMRERLVFNALTVHMGVTKARAETCLRAFRESDMEFTMDEAKDWLGL